MARKAKKPEAEPCFGGPDGRYLRTTERGYRNGVRKQGDRYYISPGRMTQIMEVTARRQAAQVLMKAMQEMCAPIIEQAIAATNYWWDNVLADIGVAVREGWQRGTDENGEMFLHIPPQKYVCLACGEATTNDPAEHLQHQMICPKHPAAVRIRELEVDHER